MSRPLVAALCVGWLTVTPAWAGDPTASARTVVARALPAVVSISTRLLQPEDFAERAPGRVSDRASSSTRGATS